MRREDAFCVEGRVTEVLSGRTWRVELANGHRLLGFAAGRTNRDFTGLKPGHKVKLQLTPFDLSTGRLLEAKKDELK